MDITIDLKEYGGQRCDVQIICTEHVTLAQFRSQPGYGHPVLSLEKLEYLVDRMRNARQSMGGSLSHD